MYTVNTYNCMVLANPKYTHAYMHTRAHVCKHRQTLSLSHTCERTRRAFEDPDVIHVEDRVDPVADLDIIHSELRLKVGRCCYLHCKLGITSFFTEDKKLVYI
jgi:hypothetical protein